jgi:hypothetical protein
VLARFMEHEMKRRREGGPEEEISWVISSHVHILIRCWVPGVGPVRLSLVFLGL